MKTQTESKHTATKYQRFAESEGRRIRAEEALPDLLEACEEALEALRPVRNESEALAVQALIAAIAKAKGQP